MERRKETPLELVMMLGATDWQSRAAAADQLRKLGSEAVDALIEGSTHADLMIRAESVALMDHLADARCAEALRRALTDSSPHVRRHAVHALGCQPCKRHPVGLDTVGLLVERALGDPSVRVRRAAAHQLGLQRRDERALEALGRILCTQRDEKLLRITRWAVGRLASPAVPGDRGSHVPAREVVPGLAKR